MPSLAISTVWRPARWSAPSRPRQMSPRCPALAQPPPRDPGNGQRNSREIDMLHRRTLLLSAAALALAVDAAAAEDWKAKYPELVFALIPDENASGVTGRWTPFTEYLSKELGTKVTLRIANDYAAVIEGQRAGNIHIAYYGPASY